MITLSRSHAHRRANGPIEPNEVRLGIAGASNGFDIYLAVQERFADAVHPIHNAAVGGEDDRKTQIGLFDETRVLNDSSTTAQRQLNDSTARRLAGSAAKPVGFVELKDRG